MKTAGIIIVIIGIFTLIADIAAAANGHKTLFAGITWIAIGGILIYSANRKAEEEEKKRKWSEGE